MKLKTILASAMVALLLSSCSKTETPDGPVIGESNVGYISIAVETQKQSRGSSELTGTENDLKSLYLITFDDSDAIVGIPGSSTYYSAITSSVSASPGAVKVSTAATNLVVIANPGAKLLAALNTLNASSTYATFNAAITGATIAEIDNGTAGFTMISCDEATATANQILKPYVDIDGKMTVVATTDAAAKAEAEESGNRVAVTIERLASKLEVAVGGTVSKPEGSTFAFGTWTVDAVNGSFYPFAEKTLGTNHTSGTYTKNFYTKDPNYTDNTGISYGVVAPGAANSWSYEPVLAHSYTWQAAASTVYTLENTMAAAEQRFQNATRLVIKATYYPSGFSSGDWFHFAGYNYDLTSLKTAYGVVENVNLQAACDAMYAKIAAYYINVGKTLAAADFAALTQAELDEVKNGGEVVKDGANAVIRWYQDGLNYYYYEIRHNNDADGHMAFSKYGVVRNNWYKLTLNSVSGAGTPWYPDIINPGPGDPDPTDPIDEEAGYLGITVTVADWILWETGFGI